MKGRRLKDKQRLAEATWDAAMAAASKRPSFSDFIRNASVEEKEFVYKDVLEKATKRQNDEQTEATWEADQESRSLSALVQSLDAKCAELERDVERMTTALQQSMTALDDWLNTYAPDMCDASRVEEARKRIMQYGTIGYITYVQEVNRDAMSNTNTKYK